MAKSFKELQRAKLNVFSKDEVLSIKWDFVGSIDNKPTTLSRYGITDAYTKTEVDSKHWDWDVIDNKPTTRDGYGLSDVYTKSEVNGLNWDWSHITSKPSTVSGYGITDAYTKNEVYNKTEIDYKLSNLDLNT